MTLWSSTCAVFVVEVQVSLHVKPVFFITLPGKNKITKIVSVPKMYKLKYIR